MARTALSAIILILASIAAIEARAQSGAVVFASHHTSEELHFFGLGPRGTLLPSELGLLGDLMRCRRTNTTHPIHPRLAQHLVRVARYFGRPVVIVSGYRAKARPGHRRSFHHHGMAADIYVKGVPAVRVRDLAVKREIGGIGFYPNSGFVHLDVRPRRFWWVDYSRPGQRDRLIPDPEGDAPPAEPESSKSLSRRSKTDRPSGRRRGSPSRYQ